MFVNDLPGEVLSSIKMCADDTKIVMSVSQASDVHILQTELNALLEWSERWQLPFNLAKCGTLRLGQRNDDNVYRRGDT